ncbi:hypothetical protein LZ30DRAFT_731334 [Colletotrichum cereale]|nr:hypothetical protein LZ30DRAFT_731334 [Colletotrichum cereale]
MSTCFDRNSNQDLQLIACDPNGGLKSCCAPRDSCASNGLCVTPNPDDTFTDYFINGCTDPNWNSDTCLRQCDESGGNGVKSCGKGKFCCFGLQGCDCNNATAVFSLDPVVVVASIPISASTTPSATSITSRSISTSTAETTASIPTSSVGSEPQSSDSSNVLSVGLGVGLGVGIPLIAFVIALVWFLKRRRGSKQVAVTPLEPPKQEIGYHGVHRFEELGVGQSRSELQAKHPPAELPGNQL